MDLYGKTIFLLKFFKAIGVKLTIDLSVSSLFLIGAIIDSSKSFFLYKYNSLISKIFCEKYLTLFKDIKKLLLIS